MTLTTDEASHARFTSTRFGKGYSTEEVDAFIQEIIAALRAWETGTVVGAPPSADGGPAGYGGQTAGAPYGVLTSRDVTSKKFVSTRFREGYEQGQVDAFMQKVAETLRAWETGAAAGAPQPDDGGAPGHDARPAGAPAGALTSEDVLNKKLQVTRFREGYEQDEVDELLDDVVQTLRAWETGAAAGAPQPDDGGAPGHDARPAGAPAGALTSEDVLNKKLQVTRFREGYEQDEVDELLDAIMRVLRGHEARSGH